VWLGKCDADQVLLQETGPDVVRVPYTGSYGTGQKTSKGKACWNEWCRWCRIIAQDLESKNVHSHPLTCEDDVALFVSQKFHNEADWKSPTLYLDPYISTVDHKIA